MELFSWYVREMGWRERDRGRYRNRDKETSREMEIASQHIPLQGDPANGRYYLLGLSKPQGL